MTLKIRDDEVYDQNGIWLKTISCPKKLAMRDLDEGSQGNYSCIFCEKTIHNTDIMTEKQIVELSKQQPDVCLSINLKNPLFERFG
ncbi:hypothetical protein N9X02_11705 [Planktomarina temperata]|jgi:hypothetical protein|nr:hypothetical protein [Planktomarina temperata]